jgi:hypothetical protein
MSDRPPQPPPPPPVNKAPGTILGCLTLPAAFLIGALMAAVTPALGLPAGILGLGAAIFFGRTMPGFLRGIVWFFAIGVITFGACVAILAGSGGFH